MQRSFRRKCLHWDESAQEAYIAVFGTGYRITAARESDADGMVELYNDIGVARTMVKEPYPYTKDDADLQILSQQADVARQNAYTRALWEQQGMPTAALSFAPLEQAVCAFSKIRGADGTMLADFTITGHVNYGQGSPMEPSTAHLPRGQQTWIVRCAALPRIQRTGIMVASLLTLFTYMEEHACVGSVGGYRLMFADSPEEDRLSIAMGAVEVWRKSNPPIGKKGFDQPTALAYWVRSVKARL